MRALPLAVGCLVLAACAKPVPIRSSYGQLGPVAPLTQPFVLVPMVDGRGANVQGTSHGYTVDLPDTVSTSTTDLGSYTLYTTTYHDGGTASITTGYTFGTRDVASLGDEVIRVLGATPGVGERVLVAPDPLVRGVNEQDLARACAAHGARRAVVAKVHRLEIRSDAQSDWMGWAYLIGGTLGLASPFIPLERWHATVDLTADVYLYEAGQGLTRRERVERSYHTSGPGLPGWRSVMGGAVPWAWSHASTDLAAAALRLARS